MRLKFECPECGPQETLLFDASYILERPYEGVWFVLKHDAKGHLVAEAQKKDASYLREFAIEKHLREAAEIAEETLSAVYCPKCEEPFE